jgi:hypothetical protein
MKTKINVLFLLLAVLVAGFMTSCSDDDDEETGADIFTSKTWVFDKIETDATDEMITGFMLPLMNAALTGATVNATADGSYTMTVLGEAETGTWSLSSDDTQLTIDPDDDNDPETDDSAFTVTLTTLTKTSVVWEETETTEGLTYTLTYYWK